METEKLTESKLDRFSAERRGTAKNPKKRPITCTMLVILSTIFFSGSGAHFVYNMLQGMSTPLYDLYHFTTVQIHSIYTTYYFLNFFISPLAGILIVKIGIRNGLSVFTMSLFIGILIAMVGLSLKDFRVIQLGFVFIGIGNENTINCQVAAINKWFSGSILSLAMGLNFSYSYTIGALSDFMCPELFLKFRSVLVPFFVAGIMGFIGFFGSICFNLLDFFDEVKKNQIASQRQALLERQDLPQQQSESESGSSETSTSYQFRLKDLCKLKPLYWMTVVTYSLLYNCYSQFAHISTDIAVRRYGYEYRTAKNFIAGVKLVVLLTLPLWSFIVLKLGKKSLIIFLSTVVCTAGLTLMYLAPLKPSLQYISGIGCMGLFFGLYLSCIWPSLTLTLPKSAATVGLGIASSSQMLGNMVSPAFIGYFIKARTAEAYGNALLFLIAFSAICIVASAMLWVVDLRTGRILDRVETSPEVLSYCRKIDEEFTESGRSKKISPGGTVGNALSGTNKGEKYSAPTGSRTSGVGFKSAGDANRLSNQVVSTRGGSDEEAEKRHSTRKGTNMLDIAAGYRNTEEDDFN